MAAAFATATVSILSLGVFIIYAFDHSKDRIFGFELLLDIDTDGIFDNADKWVPLEGESIVETIATRGKTK